MNALTNPPFPQNPSVGQTFGGWVWNGVRWVYAPTSGIAVNTVVITQSGPYMPSPGLTTCIVHCMGGGGGGGACSSTGPQEGAGGGGGAGGYSRKTLPASLVLGGVSVTIGAGGSGSVSGITEGDGGPTSFGALCVANGGFGGYANDGVNAFGAPGQGGSTVGAIGDLCFAGDAGGPGTASAVVAGQVVVTGFGGSMFGGGGIAWPVGNGGQIVGDPGKGYGAGGGGAAVNGTASLQVGGDGAPGVCWIDEYIWSDAGGGGECVNPPIEVNARVAVTQVPWTGPGPCPPGWGQGGYVGYDGEG